MPTAHTRTGSRLRGRSDLLGRFQGPFEVAPEGGRGMDQALKLHGRETVRIGCTRDVASGERRAPVGLVRALNASQLSENGLIRRRPDRYFR